MEIGELKRWACAALIVATTSACSGTVAGLATDGAVDSQDAAGADSGSGVDAGVRPDASVPPDAGVRPDASVPPDAGVRPDAGPAPDAGTGSCGNNPGQLFPPGAPWNTPIDGSPLDSESGAIISYLATNHTASARFQITFDFNILYADASTTRRSFTQTGDFYDPDCDPAPMPVPSSGRLEGESDYYCSTDGDCHLTVINRSECRLYEMWRANILDGTATGTFEGGCLAIWDLSTVPPATERGDFCTSADAAGLPILPLVFTADEVASGTIEHAVRFIMPNNLIRHYIYVRPGTHSTGPTSGGASAPPYAIRVRLKASKDLSGLSAGAQVIARALKKYGMILADGGNVTFTAATDDLTTHKWADVGVDADSLKSLSWNDFEVPELGERIDWGTGTCERTPITQ